MSEPESLTAAVGAFVSAVPADVTRALANHIGQLSTQADAEHTPLPVTSPQARAFARRIFQAWARESHVTPQTVSFALGAVLEGIQAVDVVSAKTVLTGPDTDVIPNRRTEQVVHELIDTANTSIWIISYVAYDVPEVLLALQQAVARRCAVKLLLELSKEAGGTLEFDDVRNVRQQLPGATILQWPLAKRGVTTNGTPGILHTKCLVADARRLFVTSANLSSNAQEVNMELGLLIEGGTAPRDVHRHFERLEARGELVEVLGD